MAFINVIRVNALVDTVQTTDEYLSWVVNPGCKHKLKGKLIVYQKL